MLRSLSVLCCVGCKSDLLPFCAGEPLGAESLRLHRMQCFPPTEMEQCFTFKIRFSYILLLSVSYHTCDSFENIFIGN